MYRYDTYLPDEFQTHFYFQPLCHSLFVAAGWLVRACTYLDLVRCQTLKAMLHVSLSLPEFLSFTLPPPNPV